MLPHLPLNWTKEEFEFYGTKYAAADHVAILIQPNPLAADRYVVLNSGHTFGEKELASLNYLLFSAPGRLGGAEAARWGADLCRLLR